MSGQTARVLRDFLFERRCIPAPPLTCSSFVISSQTCGKLLQVDVCKYKKKSSAFAGLLIKILSGVIAEGGAGFACCYLRTFDFPGSGYLGRRATAENNAILILGLLSEVHKTLGRLEC